MADWSANYINGGGADQRPDTANAVASTGPACAGCMPAVPYLSQAPQGHLAGLPGLIAAATGSDPSDPVQFLPPAGGLLGLIQDYMRANPAASGSR